MKEWEKKYIDVDYIIERDKIIKYLIDNERSYSLYDIKKIKKILKKLIKILEKGGNNEK